MVKNAPKTDAALLTEMTERIEEVTRVAELAFAALAEEIRAGYIIPACLEHKLAFMQGNGTFYFAILGSDLFMTVKDEVPRNLRRELYPIFDVLNLELSNRQLLGYLVSDFDPRDPFGRGAS